MKTYNSERFKEADKSFLVAKQENTVALKKVKALTVDTKEYQNYLKAYANKKAKLDDYQEAKKEESFLLVFLK